MRKKLYLCIGVTFKRLVMYSKRPQGTFWIRKDRVNKNNECQVYIRYFCRKYVLVPTGIYCKMDEWDDKRGVIKGNGRLATEKNYRLTKKKEECDRKVLEYDGILNPMVLEKILKEKGKDGKFFEEVRKIMDTLVSNKSISISSHRHRMYQLGIMEKWGNENGYTGISIREMGEGLFLKDFWNDRINVLKSSTLSTYIHTLLAFCGYLRENGKMTQEETIFLSDMAKSFRKAKEYNDSEEKDAKWLDSEAIRNLEEYQCKNEYDRVRLDVFLFSFYTCGLRMSDVLTLEWCHVTDDWHIDKVQVKVRAKQKLPPLVSMKGRKILERYKGKGRFVFGFFDDHDDMGGREFYAKLQRMEGSINKVLKRIGRELGIDKINPHMARHSATVHLLSAGLDITTVAYLLGHSNTNQIERTYGGFLKEYKEKKAEMAAHVLDSI